MLLPTLARCLSLCALAWVASSGAHANGFAFRDAPDGISCKFFDVALGLAWPGAQLPWVDAAGQAGGSRAYAVQSVDPKGSRIMRWNVLALLKAWGEGSVDNEGLVVAAVGAPGGGADFHACLLYTSDAADE